EQAAKSPHEAWVEFIINRVSPNQSIEKVASQFGPMLDAMSPAPDPVAVYFPLEPELFGVFGQDPFVAELYTRYWFSRKIKFLSERVLEAGTATGALDKQQWKRPARSKAQAPSVRTALKREWHKRGDLLLLGWLGTISVLLATLVWLLLSLLLKETFSRSPPSLLWFLVIGSLTIHLIGTIRWVRVARLHLANIRELRGRPMRRLRFGDTESARLREEVESQVKQKKAARPLAVAGCLILVVGILIAIAVPNYLTALQRSRQKRTMADMRMIATAWEARATDVNRYNAAGQISESAFPQENVPSATLAENLSPTYIRAFPRVDGWSNPFVFSVDQSFGTAKPAMAYAVRSNGRDGKPGEIMRSVQVTKDGQPETSIKTANFDCDIIFMNGVFVQYPEGVQQ
ncbi:MAG: hypothetical protein JO088_23955, partial [Acidobacteria bacterium]|nr:hypothetical protein [Acidobacteriota bacterium]